MKGTAVVGIIVAFLVLGSLTLAQSSGVESPPACTVGQGTISGGGYQLTSLAWQISGTASGGSYRLLGAATPSLRGSGCCCTRLPLVLRGFP
jgi:hypothetical protein